MTRHILLILVFSIGFIESCYTPRIQVEVLDDEQVCNAMEYMILQLQNSGDILGHLYIPQDSVSIHINKDLYSGILSFARYECAKYLSEGMDGGSAEWHNIYQRLYKESTPIVRYTTNCPLRYTEGQPNIRVIFWYDQESSILTLSAVSRPEPSGYHRGYYRSIHIVEAGTGGAIEVVEGKWVE